MLKESAIDSVIRDRGPSCTQVHRGAQTGGATVYKKHSGSAKSTR